MGGKDASGLADWAPGDDPSGVTTAEGAGAPYVNAHMLTEEIHAGHFTLRPITRSAKDTATAGYLAYYGDETRVAYVVGNDSLDVFVDNAEAFNQIRMRVSAPAHQMDAEFGILVPMMSSLARGHTPVLPWVFGDIERADYMAGRMVIETPPGMARGWGGALQSPSWWVSTAIGLALGYASLPEAEGTFLFRGTSRGFPGSPGLQRIAVTPTTTDPLVGTLFAIESSNYGPGEVLMLPRASVQTIPGNYLAHIEDEVGVSLSPTDFAARATSIPVADARAALKSMGFTLPGSIADKDALAAAIRSYPRLTPEQVRQFATLVGQ